MNKENFFDENVYNYIKKSQTSRFLFYFTTIIVLGVMIGNELDFIYNSFQFTIVGCKNISSIQSYDNSYEYSMFSTANESTYSFETCIQYDIQTCIPELYKSTSNQSLSFSIPIFLSSNLNLSKNFQSDIYSIYYLVGVFSSIILFFFYVERSLYVFRTRAHLLLSVNILIKKKNKIISIFLLLASSILVLLYSFLKYLMITGLQKNASIIMCNQNPVALFFEGKSQSSPFGIGLNFLLFLFIFKDPILDFYNNLNEFYDELKLVNFILSKNSTHSLERLKLIKSCDNVTITKAVTKFVDKNYPKGSISWFERYRRNRVFDYLKTTKVDFIPAVLEFYQENPHLFIPVISNQVDFESNGENDSDVTNLIN
ncbi:hypothetical protein RB653_006699 [Dictyostelium firmibasis]|uniref:Uncharacterized protein n=1 Tax=Dictyostelium firmibasis TaxID=79012 RepID=A0AAN7YNC3_9MYCE